MEEIAKIIGVDSLGYLSIEDVVKLADNTQGGFCTACFGGGYPTAVPQDSGNKCRVRYAKVMDKKGRGMLFFGDELSFSALPYTPHELENAAHHFELPPVHYTVVRVAKKQMGVGGDDSWGSHTHPEYLLDASEKMEFTFCFRGI